jgi:hypothetical protein
LTKTWQEQQLERAQRRLDFAKQALELFMDRGYQRGLDISERTLRKLRAEAAEAARDLEFAESDMANVERKTG